MQFTSPHIISSPGDLLANLPGIFGFFPTESIVLMTFEDIDNRTYLGPTLRCDIDNAEDVLPQALADLARHHFDHIFAFVVSARPAGEYKTTFAQLFDAADATEIDLPAAWHVKEIAVAERYSLFLHPLIEYEMFLADLLEELGERSDCFDTTCTQYAHWIEGMIPELATAPAWRPFTETGQLPALSREDVVAPLQKKNHCFSELDRQEMQELVEIIAHNALAGILGTDETSEQCTIGDEDVDWLREPTFGVEKLREQCLELLHEARNHGTNAQEEFLHERSLLLDAALTVAKTPLRDISADFYLESPNEAAPILLAVAQSFAGEIRANAMCLYAAAQIKRGFAMTGGIALRISAEEHSLHRLTQLMLRCYNEGIAESCVEKVQHGSQLAYRQFTAA
ncbi:MAG: DUF4192 domain-containing protein [Corynebacterium sp.]|nr:DUF4192 domain-containing protein [Corynebacterium sp.]